MGEIRKERRKFPRIEKELFVRYKILSPPGKEIEAQIKNIGGGGVCLVAHEQFKPGTQLVLEIKFPSSPNLILATGQVIWSNYSSLGSSPAGRMRYDNGIAFAQISDVDRQQIIEGVKQELEKKNSQSWKVGIVKDLPEQKAR